MTNRLAEESSPYLQQHKDNPVDWYPWGELAKSKATEENKPLFISIGYSTCHWCHVMARESFEDKKTADFMNENFVNIKIDREEYPGVDKVYQTAFQMIHQRGGGWPLSVWAFPDGTPFYLGTYFPDEPRHGMPSFMDVNQKLLKFWNEDQIVLDTQGKRLVNGLSQIGSGWNNSNYDLTEDLYNKEVVSLQSRFDTKFGGIGGAPKFPRVSTFRFLLREGLRKGFDEIIDFTSFTFHKMAKGGIYDQLGGGFARYSVDKWWLVPHFEKMLYDNGALVKLGAELAASTGDSFVEFVVRDTIAWLAREMRNEGGGFYAAVNAESEGREGAFYVWYKNELVDLLGEDFPLAEARYGITEEGNFEDPHHPDIKGMNVLSIQQSIDQLSSKFGIDREMTISKLEKIRQVLYQEREKKEKPSTDTKILTSWNCIAIRGLLTAGTLLQFPEATSLGIKALDFLLENNIGSEKVLRKYSADGKPIEGILDDYSFIMAALVDAFEVTDNWNYILQAEEIIEWTEEKFYDDKEGIYYMNPSYEHELFNRMVQESDDSMESGLGVMVYVLFKLGKYLERPDLVDRGQEIINRVTGRLKDYPGAMSSLLNSASLYLRYPHEIVMIQPTPELDEAVLTTPVLDRLIYRYSRNNSTRPDWEVLEYRKDQDEPTIFICEGQTCSLPINSPEQVKEKLAG